jgi:hypothetical protein
MRVCTALACRDRHRILALHHLVESALRRARGRAQREPELAPSRTPYACARTRRLTVRHAAGEADADGFHTVRVPFDTFSCDWSGHVTRHTYAMLCYATLYATLCYAMLRYATLCYAMLCYAMLCYAMLRYAMLRYATLCYAMLCYAMLRYAMLCYAMGTSHHRTPACAASVHHSESRYRFTGDCHTKDPDGKQHYCCDTNPEKCPSTKALAAITAARESRTRSLLSPRAQPEH